MEARDWLQTSATLDENAISLDELFQKTKRDYSASRSMDQTGMIKAFAMESAICLWLLPLFMFIKAVFLESGTNRFWIGLKCLLRLNHFSEGGKCLLYNILSPEFESMLLCEVVTRHFPTAVFTLRFVCQSVLCCNDCVVNFLCLPEQCGEIMTTGARRRLSC